MTTQPLVATASTVSVVIPTRGRPDRVLPLVARVLAEPELTDVVVVTGTGDPSLAPLRAITDPRLTVVVPASDVDAAQARLAGAQRASGEILVLLDDDVLPEPGFAGRHAAYHVRHPHSAVAGAMPVRLPPQRAAGQAPIRLYAEEWQRCRDDNRADPLRALWLGHLSLPRAVFLDVETRQSDVWTNAYHEDSDLGLRLAGAGLTGVTADDIRAEHLQQRDLADLLRDADRQARGLVQLAVRHPEQHGELPAYFRSPAWLYSACRLLTPTPVRATVLRAGALAAAAAGRARLWRVETVIVRVLRRVAGMVALRRALARPESGSVTR